MFTPDSFFPVLERLLAILDRCGVRYHVSGGFAAIYHAEPRLTQDVDLVVDPEQMKLHLDEFLAAISGGAYLADAGVIRDAVARGRMFQVIDTQECLKVDLYPRELVSGALDRSVLVELTPGWRVPLVSRPDAVISKLIWISKGSHKSRRDVKQIMRRTNEEEKAMIYKFADQLSLRPLLEEVLAEPDEIDA